jgi:two-component system response regulator AtoC
LQENTLERLGSNRKIPLDIRVIAASNRNPRESIRDGHLREDLYYRLNVFAVDLPPLRKRKEDIADLTAHFIAKHSHRTGSDAAVSADVLLRLQAYDWPGNVRELENMVERALILCGKGSLKPEHFPIDSSAAAGTPELLADSPVPVGSLMKAVEALEVRMIQNALAQADGSKPKAAALLDISERTLWYKVKKYLPLAEG